MQGKMKITKIAITMYNARLTCSFKVLVYVLTFIAYATYHMSRKPFSVVKVSPSTH